MATSKFRTQNLRIGRHSAPHQFYMITTVTHLRAPLFDDLYTGRCVVNALMQAEASAQTLAYVVMPDHLHWLMQLQEGASLASTVQFVKTVSAKSINDGSGLNGKSLVKRLLRSGIAQRGSG